MDKDIYQESRKAGEWRNGVNVSLSFGSACIPHEKKNPAGLRGRGFRKTAWAISAC
jgi:hypothetical protein